MKLTSEEIERGLRELGLFDTRTRETLEGLSRITRPEAQSKHETITADHTSQELEERSDARLESSS